MYLCKKARASDIDLIRQVPRPLEGGELFDKDIEGDSGSTSLLLSDIITIPNVDRPSVQLLLPDDKNKVVLGDFSVSNLLLKRVLSVIHVRPESGCGQSLLHFGSVVFLQKRLIRTIP